MVTLERRRRRIRKWRVHGFRYSLVYAVLDDVVRILAVVPPDEGFLFLTYAGVGFNPDYHGVRHYVGRG